jgi:hypothetical protein
MLALASSEAPAQIQPKIDIAAAVKATEAEQGGKTAAAVAAPAFTTAAPAAQQGVLSAAAVTRVSALYETRPSQSVTVALPATASTAVGTSTAAVAKEASWLSRGGWKLYDLVNRFSAGAPLDEQAQCIAIAVYHEARGESVDGQLAVAKVIMNRAASGKYPSTWCGTVKQPWQFSFVNPRTGAIPYVDETSVAWRKALGVTRLAIANAVPTLSNDVLWYHADYVAPSWGRRLSMVQKIGTHIFYRA